MRVTTDLWVSALVRRVFTSGGFAAIARRGATEAGAAFLISRDRLGGLTLYGPAPQTTYDEARPTERKFMLFETAAEPDVIERRLERERRFDPDVWIVEVEEGAVPITELFDITTL